ncbi:polyketide synthase regulator, putative [Babesia ovis]|uniref:Polyketide synthase regulator, putative n=1 Tax=Babesia ovis TaxID=5869 RepID=A0A9W5T9H3_BABOV|nr:polyketide synthase regulator, putative [Babesia ovis]
MDRTNLQTQNTSTGDENSSNDVERYAPLEERVGEHTWVVGSDPGDAKPTLRPTYSEDIGNTDGIINLSDIGIMRSVYNADLQVITIAGMSNHMECQDENQPEQVREIERSEEVIKKCMDAKQPSVDYMRLLEAMQINKESQHREIRNIIRMIQQNRIFQSVNSDGKTNVFKPLVSIPHSHPHPWQQGRIRAVNMAKYEWSTEDELFRDLAEVFRKTTNMSSFYRPAFR